MRLVWCAFIVLLLMITGEIARAETRISDDDFFLTYTVPAEWAPWKNAESDLSVPVRAEYLLHQKALVIIAAKRNKVLQIGSAEEEALAWVSAMRDAGDDPSLKLISSTVKILGGKPCAYGIVEGIGTGTRLGSGHIPTKRAYIYIPNGIDLILVYFTCPSVSYDKWEPEVLKVITEAKFTDKKMPPPQDNLNATEPPADHAPPTTPIPQQADVINPLTRFQNLSQLAFVRAEALLLEAGIPVYEPIFGNPPYDLLLLDKDGNVARAKVLLPQEEKVKEAELTWAMEKKRLGQADVVILLKSRNALGWIVPVKIFQTIADTKDQQLILPATNAEGKSALELLKSYSPQDFGKSVVKPDAAKTTEKPAEEKPSTNK